MDTRSEIIKQKAKSVIAKTIAIAFLIIMAFVVLVPFYWMLNTSLKNEVEVQKEPPTLYPHEWSFENYRIAFLGRKKNTIRNAKNDQKLYPGLIKQLKEKLAATPRPDIEGYEELIRNAKLDINNKANLIYKDNYINLALKVDEEGYSYTNYLDHLIMRDQVKIQIKELESKIIELESKDKSNIELTLLKVQKTKLEEKLKEHNIYIEKFNKKHTETSKKISVLKDEEIFLDDKLQLHREVTSYKAIESELEQKQKYYNNLPNIISTAEKQKPDDFGKYLLNTLIVGIGSTIVGTFMSIVCAFALSRLKFKGRDTVFSIMMATMMIPGEMMVISNYITVSKAGWTDQAPAFAGAPFLAMTVPFLVTVFHIYLLRQNFKQIPNELYYAAKVDGTSDFKYLWRVMVPLAKSSIITITILKLMGSWNAYIWPNLVAGENHKLITVWLRSSFNDSTAGRILIEQQMAATVIVLIPLLLVFIFLRRYIMRGVARGGTKG